MDSKNGETSQNTISEDLDEELTITQYDTSNIGLRDSTNKKAEVKVEEPKDEQKGQDDKKKKNHYFSESVLPQLLFSASKRSFKQKSRTEIIEKDKRETTNKRKLRKSQMSSSNSDMDKQSHVFGVSLDELVKRNQRGGVIPDFVIKVFRYLRDTAAFEEEGIFRISGHGGIQDELKWAFDKGMNIDLNKYKGCNCHVVAGLFKMWLSLLPEPLLSFDLYDQWMASYDLWERDENDLFLATIKDLVQQLPEATKPTLQLLLSFLHEVTNNEKVNKMNSKNVALVFAPTLIHSKGPTNVTKEFADMPRAITVVQFLIEESEKLFPTALPDNVLDIVETIEDKIIATAHTNALSRASSAGEGTTPLRQAVSADTKPSKASSDSDRRRSNSGSNNIPKPNRGSLNRASLSEDSLPIIQAPNSPPSPKTANNNNNGSLRRSSVLLKNLAHLFTGKPPDLTVTVNPLFLQPVAGQRAIKASNSSEDEKVKRVQFDEKLKETERPGELKRSALSKSQETLPDPSKPDRREKSKSMNFFSNPFA